ncbi:MULTISPECIES: glycoside hydrolase family 3 N-terminal domain-containing protein [Bacteroides]|uniref:glycoside hydrolase family 3 N-terminal domain-containing protein n=1 Tax=Bacteroides TaxID=816 RepID=UPI001E55BAE9|nr:glycoside hydrolase family 3 N-terminal domain-containing protein [Bacteroides stercoris]MCS3036833.1 glycoside hydrolase family 3 C-terminal domain-containing protein [Bacteroides stercoris]MDC7133309.1 glycoside hydrolase family 3 N-terminal domain-containing protein [Bacteroides stercoris]
MASCHQQTPAPVIVSDVQVEEKVEQVLSKMTLDEKIGQMTQLSIDVLGSFVNGEFVLDESKLQQAIAEFKVGSVLNAPGPVAQTAAKWQEIIGRIQEVSMKEIGIPCIYGLDQTHGTTYTLDGILFPQNINIAASFNPELAYEAARITAYETRAGSCPWTFSPTVDMARDPRWSRIWENFGEDCLVNAVMGSQSILGYQGDEPNHIPANRIAASVKHYMGYSSARTGKDRTPAYISESELREKCFAPFKACVEAGALTIMVNSGSINGVPVHANHELLTKWLKEDLQWDGMLVTDWADINNLYTREHVAASKKEAIKMAVNAGIDMAMEPYDLGYCTLLKELVEENEVSMARIDDAVRRVLRLKVRLGLFEQPITPMADYPLLGSEEHAQLALKAAEESEILLKNKDQILPLKKGTKILVTGPNAHSMRCLNGGWSYSWQGHLADRFASKYNTLYEAICQEFGADHVRLEQGVTYVAEGTYTEENTPEIAKAVAAAHQVDVIIACIGENSYCETPGNLSEMAISENQRNLVKALATTGKPMILVLNEGRPRIIHDLEPLAQGIIHIMLPGNFGGNALANILSGEANPSAKMPYTYPRHEAELTTYDYRVSEEMDKMEGAYDYDAVISVQWPFGYGLSYTTFEYSRLVCSHSDFNVQDELTFTVDVTNTGKRTGKEVVMLFSRDMVASLTPENRRLRAFQKVELKPGETKQVTLKIPASDLAFVGSDGRWILEAGEFRIQVGNQLIHIQCSETYQWNTPNR